MFFLRSIGIGRCIALKLSNLGAKDYAVSRTEADLDSLKKEVRKQKMLWLFFLLTNVAEAVELLYH